MAGLVIGNLLHLGSNWSNMIRLDSPQRVIRLFSLDWAIGPRVSTGFALSSKLDRLSLFPPFKLALGLSCGDHTP